MKELNISSPWVIFCKEVDALFKNDPDVMVDYNGEGTRVVVRVEGAEKADALSKLLPRSRTFGNVTVRVEVIPANMVEENKVDLFRKAFEGNPAMSFIQSTKKSLYTACYAVFRKEVVQFFNDDLSDLNGMCSTLYQDIADDVFDDHPGIFFCTDTK